MFITKKTLYLFHLGFTVMANAFKRQKKAQQYHITDEVEPGCQLT